MLSGCALPGSVGGGLINRSARLCRISGPAAPRFDKHHGLYKRRERIVRRAAAGALSRHFDSDSLPYVFPGFSYFVGLMIAARHRAHQRHWRGPRECLEADISKPVNRPPVADTSVAIPAK
jgi:hypothetical protein